jgi:peptidoglycan/xylan/chitin deacetylase (PgdA/CDA1 family)
MKKQELSRVVKNVFLRIGVYDFLRRLKPNFSVAILRYHAVVDKENNFYTSPSIALSPLEFEKQVKYFTSKYHILSLNQVKENLKQNKAFPLNSVVFTFDDGYADNFEAAQTLQKYNANGTFYITTDPIDRKSRLWLSEVIALILKTEKQELNLSLKNQNHSFLLDSESSRWHAIREIIKIIKSNNLSIRELIRSQLLEQLGKQQLLKMIQDLMLNWKQIYQMLGMGMTIGSHTITHLNLPNANPLDAKAEIRKSKEVLEKKLGIQICHFSYPNSGPYEYYNNRIKSYVQNAGYESSSTSQQGYVNRNSDFFALERVRTVSVLADVIHQIEWDRVFQ